jgi:predicted short-subunit dehydrogenase-like oxidoreductase (DUF2520 family)
VGGNLLRHFVLNGLNICAVIEPKLDRHSFIRSAAPAARVLTSLPPVLPQDTDICVLAVPDDQIATLGAQLAERPMLHAGALVFHVSGIRGADDLLPLQEAGCHAGCLHPIQSFPEQPLPRERLVGIGCGIEGPDNFWTRARDFAELLGWMPLRVDPRKKALYHAACVYAGNFSTVLAAHADMLLRSATDSEDACMDYLLPMMTTVLSQLHDTPAEQILTGPAARGDAETISNHLQAIGEAHPELLSEYKHLTLAAATLASLRDDEKAAVHRLMEIGK